jgi:prepilin-type N-terminal cleavage/methylation domain-containing protein
MTTSIHTANVWRRARHGFTLIEVMISVALALILIYGVAQVFKMSTDVVGAQTAIQNIVRDHRAAVTTMTEDFRNCVFDSPLFLIDSQVAYDGTPETEGAAQIRRGFRAGYKNSFEESQAAAGSPPLAPFVKDPMTYEINGQTFQADFTSYSDRTPRLDRLGFFARGFYRRQTAANAQAGGFSSTTSAEAYIWYGHTALAGQTSPFLTGAGYPGGVRMTLPQNQYAQDRILGRLAILLADPTGINGGESYLKSAATPVTPLAPLDYDTQVFNSTPAGANIGSFQNPSGSFSSLTDLAAVTIDQWRSYANSAFTQVPTVTKPFLGPQNWYWPMDDNILDPTITTAPNQKIWRANCQPTLQRPFNSQKLAQTTSCFIPHCTQFIVEYAGDFLEQNTTNTALPAGWVTDAGQKMNPNTGAITGGKTDGEIDYYLDTNGFPNDSSKWVKRIRWYGLPRDTNGDGRIDISDVLPLADVIDYYANSTPNSPNLKVNGVTAFAPWEKVLPNPGLMAMPSLDYANFRPSPSQRTTGPMAAKNFRYVCAWHNDAPMMIRISMKFDDPTGKLQDGQWYEYVLTR